MIRALVAFVVAGLTVSLAGAASASEFPAMSACRSNYQSANVSYSDIGIQNHDTSNAVNAYCPLKVVTCSSPPCTYSVDTYAVDNNSTNATDANVTCQIHLANKATAGTHYHGSSATVPSAGPMATLSTSVTINDVTTGLVYVLCSIGKGGSSYVNWLTTTNF
jgi:hypothetical protein